MKPIGIKYQLRIAILIPILLVALLFAFFFNYQLAQDLKHNAAHMGETYVRQLLPAAQLAIFRDDLRTLQGLIDESIINPEIHALAFYNAHGDLLAARGGKHPLHLQVPQYSADTIASKAINDYTIHLIAPITLPNFNMYSPLLSANAHPHQANTVLGWLALDLDTKLGVIKRYQMYVISIVITCLGLLMSFAAHYFLSKRIYYPIHRLRRSMKQILRNEFETHIHLPSQGELGIIAAGCEHLQSAYLNIAKDLTHHIETATIDLQAGLQLLEEKNIELSLEKKKAEEKNRQKSELIANLSHEIRTPMNGIIGFTNVLMESKLDSLQLDYVKTIKTSAQDLLNILNEILDYSKLDAGKLHLECIPLNIRTCIDEIIALTAPLAHKKGIDIIPSTATNVPRAVLGDPLRLKQIISNLIHNAIKFTDRGYVLIRTTMLHESEHDYNFSIAVIDTGIGIAVKDQARLFNAYQQVDHNIAKGYGGTGLGLMICKKLAEHMQGHITVESDLNKGSNFAIHIKLAKLRAYEIEKNQVHRFSHLHIICYDDNPLHLEALCNGLGYWGIQVIAVSSFQELVTTLQHNPQAHLAFINVNQGCEQQVKEVMQQAPTVPFVLLSKWFIQNYESLGARDFIFKPPNIEKLRSTLDAFLTQQSNQPSVDSYAQHHADLTRLRDKLKALNAHILIAEDNRINRMLMHSMLQELAHLEIVADGEAAVELCQQKRFQAILLDLHMPLLNGLEAAYLIQKKSIYNQQAPIILISASGDDFLPINTHQSGITVCLAKPIDEAHLLSHLVKLIQPNMLQAIDWPLCIKKASGREALALEFLAKFVEELRLNRQELLDLSIQQHIKGIERAAHKLHGACCFFGVTVLQLHVVALENAAKHASSMQTIAATFKQVIDTIDHVIQEYEQTYHIRLNTTGETL